MSSRREKRIKQKNKIRTIIRIAILGILFCIGISVGVGIYKESKIRLLEENQVKIEKVTQTKEIHSVIPVEIESIPEIYLNFEVIAKLELPKIGLSTYVLKDYNEAGMKVCVSKFWGPEPNEIGNFCIAGHNYEQENMFHHLIDLEIGDELFLTDNKNGKYVYTIDNIYRVKPQNTAPIEQETDGRRVVTLITCVNYSRSRLIIQASEKREGN